MITKTSKERFVRKVSLFCIMCALALFAGSASAQFLGQMSPASVLETGHSNIDSYVIIGEHMVGVVGGWTYGFSQFVEGRARLGFVDPDGGDMSVILGGDMKYLLLPYKENENNFDFSLGGGFEYTKLAIAKYLSVHGSAIGSMPVALKNGKSIEPYARVTLRMQHVSEDEIIVLGTKVSGGSDTKLKIGAAVGAKFKVIDLTDFTAEIQIDEDFAFLLGITLLEF